MISLKQLVERDGPLDYRRAARFIEDVAIQLRELHARDVLHRDICPGLLILDERGLVRLQPSSLLDGDIVELDLTNDERSVLEAADYLAPEQASIGHTVDACSDIYSLGCTLYFLLTGRAPFPQGSLFERLLKHQHAKAPAIIRDRPDAPVALVELCEQMMSKKQEDRPQTATEVAFVLGAWLAGQGAA